MNYHSTFIVVVLIDFMLKAPTITRKEWIEQFYRRSGSWNTSNLAENAINWWDKFLLKNDTKEADFIEELRNMDEIGFYKVLQDFVNFMQDSNKYPTTINKYFGFTKDWLYSQGIKTDPYALKHRVKLPREPKLKKIPITQEQIRKLIDNSSPLRKAVYLIALSSLMRIGEILSLKKEDFDITTNPIKITIQAEYTKEKEDRETYITQEAWNYTKEIWENTKLGEFVFVKSLSKHTIKNEEYMFDKLRKRCGLTQKQANGRYVIRLHKFRKFGHTKASKLHDDQYANALDGHTGYLETYYELEDSERAKMYNELAPDLTVYDDNKAKTENKTLKQQLTEKDTLKEDVKKLQAQLTRLSMKN